MRWPGLFHGVDSKLEDWIVDQMFVVSSSSPLLFILMMIEAMLKCKELKLILTLLADLLGIKENLFFFTGLDIFWNYTLMANSFEEHFYVIRKSFLSNYFT